MSAASPSRRFHPFAVLLAFVLVGLLGAGAIALERPVGQANGQVHDHDTGKPLANARVTFSGPVTRTITTGPDGRYQVYNLPVGRYYVSAKRRHFDAQWHDGDVPIAEGKTEEHVDFELTPTAPSLEVANVQRVFTPKEPVRINLRGTQVPEFDATLYRLDLRRALGDEKDVDALAKPNLAKLKQRGLLSPVKTWHQAVRPEQRGDDDWFYTPVQMPDVGEGAYLVSFSGRAEGEGKRPAGALQEAYWFDVTRLALVTKRDESQLLTYAVDLLSDQPVPGVSVRTLAGKGASGTTDAHGLLHFSQPPSGPVWVLGEQAGSLALARSYFSNDNNAFRIYAYTERPVYRPGQTVYFKGLVRAQHEARYSEAAGRSVRVVIRDTNGTNLMDTHFSTDAASAFNGELQLPADAGLGEYNLECSVNDGSFENLTFKVADYRKPEFKFEITPARPRYTYGETADVNVLGSYYFGAPVPGAKVIATVYSAPLYWDRDADTDFYTGYTSEPGVEPFWGYGDVVQQTEATTDAQGRLHFQVPIQQPKADDDWLGDRVYTVAIEGMDASRRPVKATQSFRVTQGNFRLSAVTDSYVFAGNHTLGVQLKASDYDDHPVTTELQLKVDRLQNEQKKTAEGDEYTETRHVAVYSGSTRTDAHGLGRIEIPAQPEGDYEITVEAKDDRGNVIRARTWAWVAGAGGESGSYQYNALQIVLDRKVYHPGETAKALVMAPVPNLSVLLTIEGTKLQSSQVVQLHGNSALVELPVTEAYKPNAFVVASAVNGKEFLNAERSLNVLPEDKFLQVKVFSDKNRYQPGEKATYTVETRDYKGRPVAADVSLGVVDQAVYAIEPEHTPDIRGFFHGPNYNQVNTSYSFPEEYSGGLDKNAPDPRVRAKLEDTAAWYPSLRTGANGRVSVTITLPDNLTTWVATARADTASTQVGSASMNVLATKDLLVRLETPRFLVEGDRVVVSAIVHNYTEVAQPVSVRLELSGITLRDERPQTVTLKPGDAQRLNWEGTARDVGQAQVTVIAKGRTDGDAMRLPVPLEPFGLERFTPVAEAASADKPASVTLSLPANAIPATTALNLQLNTTPLPMILSAVDYLHHYEYGCVEQTMSRFLPDVAVERRLASVGAPVGDRFSDQTARIKDGVRRLVSMQHGDGGWGWWTYDDTKPEMTAYVLYGLAEARRDGAEVPQSAVDRGIAYLKRTLPTIQHDVFTRSTAYRNAGPDARAFGLFALSQWDAVPRAELDRLYRDRAALTNYGRAQFALTLARLGDFRRFEALDALASQVTESETQAYWNSGAPEFSWQDDSPETTAYALQAYLAIAPQDARILKIVRWLESRNVRGYWNSTKDTGAAAIALSEYLVDRHPEAPSGYTVHVTVNDQEVATFTPSPEDAWSVPAPIRVGMDRLKAGDNALRVTLDGTGEVDFSGGLSCFERVEHIAAAPSHGLAVSRSYYLLSADVYARAKGQGSFAQFYDEDLVRTLPQLGDRVKAGERVLVRLEVTADRAMRYLVAEDPLPAGCEILEDQPANWGYWWDNQEYRDDKAAFFFNYLAPGKHQLYYVMRPTVQGTFRVLPSRVWAMYTPEVRANGADTGLTITE